MEQKETVGKLLEHDFERSALELYDDQGRKMYREEESGDWHRFVYNEKGKVTFEKYSFRGDIYWKNIKYENNDRRVIEENSLGETVKTEYDERGNHTYTEIISPDEFVENPEEKSSWRRNEYNEKNQLVKREDSNGYITEFGYNPNGTRSWISWNGEREYFDSDGHRIDPDMYAFE
jgi:YD repeat-containing protein